MTLMAGTRTALVAVAAVAIPGGGSDATGPRGTALVIDAGAARDGRELIDPRLLDIDAEVRLPRDAREARTNVRYFNELGYRVVVAGPRAAAAADAAGVEAAHAPSLSAALAAL